MSMFINTRSLLQTVFGPRAPAAEQPAADNAHPLEPARHGIFPMLSFAVPSFRWSAPAINADKDSLNSSKCADGVLTTMSGEVVPPSALCRICFEPLDAPPCWNLSSSPSNSDSDHDDVRTARRLHQQLHGNSSSEESPTNGSNSSSSSVNRRLSSVSSASNNSPTASSPSPQVHPALSRGPNFVTPCACTGTQRFVHTTCLQHWRKRGGRSDASLRCEVCRTPYSVQIVHVPAFTEFLFAKPFFQALFPLFCQCLSVASFASLLMFSSMYVVLKGVVFALSHVCDPDGIVFQCLLLELVMRCGLRRFVTRAGCLAALVVMSLHVLLGVPLQEAVHMLAVVLPSAQAFWSRAEVGLGFGSSFLRHCSSSLAVGFLAGVAAFGIELLRQFRTYQKNHTLDRVLDYVPRKTVKGEKEGREKERRSVTASASSN